MVVESGLVWFLREGMTMRDSKSRLESAKKCNVREGILDATANVSSVQERMTLPMAFYY